MNYHEMIDSIVSTAHTLRVSYSDDLQQSVILGVANSTEIITVSTNSITPTEEILTAAIVIQCAFLERSIPIIVFDLSSRQFVFGVLTF